MIRVIEEFLEELALNQDLGLEVIEVLPISTEKTEIVVQGLFKGRATLVFSTGHEQMTPDVTFISQVRVDDLKKPSSTGLTLSKWFSMMNATTRFFTVYEPSRGMAGFKHTMLFNEGSALLVIKTLLRFMHEVEGFVTPMLHKSYVGESTSNPHKEARTQYLN